MSVQRTSGKPSCLFVAFILSTLSVSAADGPPRLLNEPVDINPELEKDPLAGRVAWTVVTGAQARKD